MKDSLKTILNNEIRNFGYITISEVYEIAKREGHKASNAERRLRRSESPNVKAIYSVEPPRAIIGYEWDNTQPQKEHEPLNNQLQYEIDKLKKVNTLFKMETPKTSERLENDILCHG